MSMRTVGLVTLGVALAGAIGGGIIWYLRRKRDQASDDGETPTIKPSRPPRIVDDEDEDEPEVDTRAKGHLFKVGQLPPALARALDEQFGDAWPPDDETIDNLTTEDLVVIGVESEPVPGFERSRTELLTAKVRSVHKTMVRARIAGPVEHAEHLGSHAGHGFREGDLVEIPRTSILVAARSTAPKREGFNSKGEAAAIFDSSHETKQTYTVRPETPYDLVLPYRTPDIEWAIDRDTVKMHRIGSKGNYEQIMFSEDSLRGPVTVRALDRDPEHGLVFVARWEFHLDP